MDFLTDWFTYATGLLRPRNATAFFDSNHAPFGIAGSGTIATNGTVTLGSAAPMLFDGGLWFYFPVSAVSGGQPGFYWTVMSSTTVGQVYTNYIPVAGMTTLPAKPTGALTPATGSNSPYANLTSSFAFASFNVPAKTVGEGDSLRFSLRWCGSGSGNKIPVFTLDTVVMTTGNAFSTGATGFYEVYLSLLNGQTNRQVAANTVQYGSTGTYHSSNFTAERSIGINLRNSTAADTVVIYQVQTQVIKKV